MTYENKPRILTGDTPTGALHLGHWVGSLENRVALQESYECFFIIANMHAFTTNFSHPEEIRQSVETIVLDYLACGIDPEKSCIFIQSEIPAIAELTFLFSMLVPLARILRNPTVKSEIRDKQLGDNYPFGFLLYPIGQVADILSFRANLVPVGEDQIPHLELTREVARKFNQLYCRVDSQIADEEHIKSGGLFPIIQGKIGRVKRLVGTSGPDKNGQLLKMSKSLNNTILLSDSEDSVQKKIMSIYTDPRRIAKTDPGTVENNPLWIFHEAFNADKAWVQEAEDKYRRGQIGDVECKRKLVDVINAFLEPMRMRRKLYENNRDALLEILGRGTERANQVTEETLDLVKKCIHQHYGNRSLRRVS